MYNRAAAFSLACASPCLMANSRNGRASFGLPRAAVSVVLAPVPLRGVISALAASRAGTTAVVSLAMIRLVTETTLSTAPDSE